MYLFIRLEQNRKKEAEQKKKQMRYSSVSFFMFPIDQLDDLMFSYLATIFIRKPVNTAEHKVSACKPAPELRK
jgi:hypothetical protein